MTEAESSRKLRKAWLLSPIRQALSHLAGTFSSVVSKFFTRQVVAGLCRLRQSFAGAATRFLRAATASSGCAKHRRRQSRPRPTCSQSLSRRCEVNCSPIGWLASSESGGKNWREAFGLRDRASARLLLPEAWTMCHVYLTVSFDLASTCCLDRQFAGLYGPIVWCMRHQHPRLLPASAPASCSRCSISAAPLFRCLQQIVAQTSLRREDDCAPSTFT